MPRNLKKSENKPKAARFITRRQFEEFLVKQHPQKTFDGSQQTECPIGSALRELVSKKAVMLINYWSPNNDKCSPFNYTPNPPRWAREAANKYIFKGAAITSNEALSILRSIK